jgi:hypothetical protein
VATGALQAFGAENEEVQKVALKLQGALNIVQGVQSIIELKEAYEDIRSVLGFTTAAQTALTGATTAGAAATTGAAAAARAFAAALTSTGIGAIVVAVGALAGAFLLAGNNASDAAEKSQELLDLEKEFNQLAKQRVENELAIRVAKGQISEEEANFIKLQSESNQLSEDSKNKLDDFIAKNKVIIDQYETLLAFSGSEESFFATFNEDAAETIAQYKQLQKNRVEAAALADEQIIKGQQDLLLNQKEDAKKTIEDQKKRNKELADSAKEAEESRLKALQDNQANIDATYAAEQSRRQQFEQELASQLGDIDNATSDKRLQNQILFFDNRQALEEQNLQDEIVAAQQRADKIAEFYGQDSQAYKNAIAQKTLLEKQFTALVIKNSESISVSVDESLEEQLRSLTIFYQNELLFNAKSLGDSEARNAADLKAYKKFLEDKIAALKAAGKSTTEAETDLANTNTSIAKDEEGEKAAIQKSIADTAIATSEFIGQLSKNRLDNEIFELENAREKGFITEEQYQEKLRALKIKQAKNDKELAIFAATVQFSQALINALTTTPASAAPAALAFTAAIAGINLAKVIATPIPKFKQGTLAVPGYDTGDDSVMAMLRPGEAVIPTETNREYAAVIRAIYTKQVSANELNEFVTSRDKRVSTGQLTEFMNSRNLTTFNEIYNSRNTTQTDRNEAKFYKYFDTERVIKSKQNTEVQLEPVFTFNPVTMEALFKRDLKVSNFNNTVVKRTGGDMPTIKVKADVDTQALGRAMAKNKGVDVNNADYLAQAIASELKKGINPRQLL